MQIPIVFIIFNRPDLAQKVFNIIRESRPSQLFVVADGHRDSYPEEAKLCQSTREIIEQVDWDCEVLTNYSDINLGCKKRISSGLDWAFEYVDRAIILEDDCCVDPSFFEFCDELLERYKDDSRIMSICGSNFQQGQKRGDASYYFSVYHDCWGWATWRRAWNHNDVSMALWNELKSGNFLDGFLPSKKAVKYWRHAFNLSYQNKAKSWFYPWLFSCWVNEGLAIVPNVNLVLNIGYDERATNTISGGSKFINLKTDSVRFPLSHPHCIESNQMADDFNQSTRFFRPLSQRIKNRIAKIVKYLCKN